ncbi:MAG: peptidoglycan-binding protein [Acidobacteria bacterium]|nr:peptidoglycan-binding protein [Acidobacteriota bacterium]
MSTNGGTDWKVTTSRQIFEVNSIAVHPSNPDVVYIGTNNYGVMVSRDGGRNFVPSNDGYSGRRAYAIVPDREKPGRVYATTINTATGGGYFYVSNDAGETWQLSGRNMPPRLIAYSILQDARDANVIYLGTNYGLYRSADRGASWAPMGAPKPKAKPKKGRKAAPARASSSAASRDGAAVAAPTVAPRPVASDGVKRAQEALNLAGYGVGKPDGVAGTRTVTALRKFQTDKGLSVTGQFDAATLGALGLGGGMQSAGAAAVAVQMAPVFLTDTINALAYTGDERGGMPGMLAATNAGLFRSYDIEKGWEIIPYGPRLDVRTLCVSTSPLEPETIFVGTSNSGVLVSRDNGKTWEQVRGIPSEAPVNVIERDPKRAQNVYVGTTQTLYVSHDGGQRWLRRGGNLPLGSFTSVLVNPENPDEVYVGNPPLPSRRVWALAFDPRDHGRIFVGTHSAGVYVARRGADAAATNSK